MWRRRSLRARFARTCSGVFTSFTRRSLRARFALWTATLLLVALTIFGGLVYVSMARGLAAALDDSLRVSAAQAIAALPVEGTKLNLTEDVPSDATAALRERGVTVRVLDAQGHVLQATGPYHNIALDSASIAAAPRGDATFTTLPASPHNDTVRVYSAPILASGQFIGILQIAQTTNSIHETLERLFSVLLVSIPLLVGSAALGGYLLARRALAPIDHITQTARHIVGADDLRARLNLPATNDEVGRLATTLNDMIARLDGAFRRERQFTADASHELRTPLAAMQLIVSVTRSERRTAPEYEQALDDLADETNRLRSLVEDLLRLARGDGHACAPYDLVDLAPLLQDVSDALRPLAEDKQLHLSCEVPPQLAVQGDRDSLVRLFVNLLDNAITYTETGSVRVCGTLVQAEVRVDVSDTGIGIAAEHLPRVFDRFYRVDAARTQRGSGLGLAIAQEIARAHGGHITIDNTPGAGTTCTVTLPAAPAPTAGSGMSAMPPHAAIETMNRTRGRSTAKERTP